VRSACSCFEAPEAPRSRTSRISAEQLVELARFVDQCNPKVLQQLLSMLA
jgi:hypothetical protein